MPTGYTAGILDGKIKTFPEFAKQCMRAFGALIHMRDEDMDKEYTPNVPGDYYKEHIDEAKKVIEEIKTLSDEELISKQRLALETSKEYHLKKIDKANADAKILIDILAEVKLWIPPTPDHAGLKDFMIQQIESTIDFDCKTDYHERALLEIESNLSSLDADTLRKEKLESAQTDLEYYIKNNNEEIERCNKSNKWVTDLLNSLN